MTRLRFTFAIAALLSTLGCQGGGGSPLAPPTPDPESQGTIPEATLDFAGTGAGLVGLYQADLNFSEGTVDLTTVPTREARAIGDHYDVDGTPYLRQSPCTDCFQVQGLSLDPDNNLLVDFSLTHPFPIPVLRRDLDVFDTRAIILTPGTTAFPTSPALHENGDGTPDQPVSGRFDLVLNADGYTSHFDTKVLNPAFFNPPLDIPGTVNPFIQFFTESDPTPTGKGFPIANHRFGQAPTVDTKRVMFRRPESENEIRVIIVIEAQWGVSSSKATPNPNLGSRQNPVYFLPAFNQYEPYRLTTDLTDSFTVGDPPSRELVVGIAIEDWQAGLLGDPTYGDLGQPGLIPYTSDIVRVTAEFPTLMGGGAQNLTRLGGSGAFGDPYTYEAIIRNDLGAAAGTHLGLISAVDSLDGAVFRPTAIPGENQYSFVAYQVVRVVVNPAGGNTPPTAIADATPNPVESGAEVGLIDHDSSDPDVGDFITKYEWDFDISDGRTYTDSISTLPDQATATYSNSGTEPMVITASLRVTDNTSTTGFVDHDITVNAPVGGNNPPTAIPLASPNPVEAGLTIQLRDSLSFDSDPDDSVTLYEWDFDVADGRTYTDSISGLPNAASTSYANPGIDPIIITASLRVTDENSATDVADLEITIDPVTSGNHPPVAIAEAIAITVESGELVRFIDSNSFDPDPNPDKVVEYAWDWDVSDGRTYDDSISAFPNLAQHAYTNGTAAPLVITASLQVKDTFGATGTDDIDITINPGVSQCTDPLAAPTALSLPTIPEPPYSVNFLTFEWTAPADPNSCLLGYAVWRSQRTGADTGWKLLTDLDADNQLDADEVIADTTFADSTLGGPGFPCTNKYYAYIVRTVSQGQSGILQSPDSNKVLIYINDFEGMNQLVGGTWRGTRSGMSWGLTNALAYPDGPAYAYGFEVATNKGNAGSTHCLDESANIASGGYGPTNHSPYAAGLNFDDFIDDGYWNTFGPQLFTDLETTLFPPTTTVRKMQLFHTFQMETYYDPNRDVEVAADMGYVCTYGESDWEQNWFYKLIDLPVLTGKDYDSAEAGINPFLDQLNWPASQRNWQRQVPKMHFFAGDYRTPGQGAPNWTKSVFNMNACAAFTKPVVQFAFAGDEYPQQPGEVHHGWSIDDILVVSY